MSIVRRSLALSFLTRYANLAISFIGIVIISRLLTPEEVGIFSVSMAIVALAHTLRQFGLSTYLIQEKDITKDRIRTAFGLAFVIAGSIGAVLVAASGLIAEFYRENGVREVLLVLAFNFLLVPIGAPALALLQREMRFGDIAKVQIVATLAQNATAILLVMSGMSYLSLAIGSVAGMAATTLALILVRAPHILILPSLGEWRHVLRFCFPAVGAHVVGELGVMMPDLAMGRLLGFGPVAYYSRALGLARIFGEGILQGVWPVALSSFSEAKRKNGDIRAGYVLGTQLLTGLALPFYAVLGVLAFPVVVLLYGEQWRESAPLLQLFCVSYLILTPWTLSAELLYAMGKARESLIKEIIIQGARIALVVAASFHSAMAVAVAQIAVGLIAATVIQYFIVRAIGVGFWQLAVATSRSVLVAVASMAPPVAVLIWAGDDLSRWFYGLPLAGAGAGLAWLAAVHLFHHPIRDEIARLLPLLSAAWSRHMAARRS